MKLEGNRDEHGRLHVLEEADTVGGIKSDGKGRMTEHVCKAHRQGQEGAGRASESADLKA